MSKIVFFCIPAHGHTNPTLSVARELIAQGHEVLYYSYEMMREKIEATGARFVSCDAFDCEQNLTEEDRGRIGKDLLFSTRVLVDTTLALDEMVCREMERIKPDCIVADSMAVWGKGVAQKLGIPYVCSTTTFAFNQQSAQVMKKSGRELLSMMLDMMRSGKEVRRLRERGYPFKNVLDLIKSDENADTVVYTSREFQPCADSFADCYSFVGPSIRQAESSLEKKREKLIYISMGTVNNNMVPLYRKCIEALKGTGYQVILSVGDLVDPAVFGKLPENIEVYSGVDQIAVLEKADVFLTHCGMNSVNEALYFGVPLLMLPQTDEQRGVGFRVEQLHAGLPLTGTEPKVIRTALEQLLKEDSYRKNAEKIAEGFRRCSGAKGAAEKILSVCKK